MSQKFDMPAARELAMKCAFWDPMPDELLPEFVAALDRIEELEAANRQLTSEESELVSIFEQRTPGRYRYLENKVRILDEMHNQDCEELRKLHTAIRKLGEKIRARGKSAESAWQITEERKEALRFGIAVLGGIKSTHRTELLTMLAEAEARP